MNPLPDRVVLIGLLTTVLLCLALAAWSARLFPGPDSQPLQWRQAPAERPVAPLI